MKTSKLSLVLLVTIIFYSCNGDNRLSDASGVFEATEIIVSAEVAGKILSFEIHEGQKLKNNQQVGFIDSTQLYLSKQYLIASKEALIASKPDIKSQIEATEKEIEKYRFEKKRIENLLAGDVATQKQLDDINSQILVLNARLKAQKNTLNTSVNSLNAQIKGMDIQIEQFNDQLRKCVIKSPIDGTVLVKYAEQGELTGQGKAIFSLP